MTSPQPNIDPKAELNPVPDTPESTDGQNRPLVSLVLPAFNEAAIIETNLHRLAEHMASL